MDGLVFDELGRKNIKYHVKATGNTASEIHPASQSDQPTTKPANGQKSTV